MCKIAQMCKGRGGDWEEGTSLLSLLYKVHKESCIKKHILIKLHGLSFVLHFLDKIK